MNKMRPIYPLMGSLLLAGMAVLAAYSLGLFGKPALGTGEALAEDSPASRSAESLYLITAYLDPPIGDAHRVFLMGVLGGPCKLSMDKLTNQPDRFGDVLSRMEKGFDVEDVKDVKVTPVATSLDGKRERSCLYEITGVDGLRLRLATPTSTVSSYRLLEVDKDGNPVRVVTLEPWVLTRARPSMSGGGNRR
jgi:hypothetical protein